MQNEDREKATAFINKMLAATRRVGGKKTGINFDVLSEIVRDDPESAAEIVLALCRQEEVDMPFAQMAMTIALAYQTVLGDDSLMNEVENAPWRAKMTLPTVMNSDDEPTTSSNSKRFDHLFQGSSIRILDVDLTNLQSGSVESFREALAVEGKDKEYVEKLTTLWGMCVLAFPLDDDPRYVWDIPEARRFALNLHEAMPYFPCYLNFRQEAGMFLVYFGCLADPAVFATGQLELEHPSLLQRLTESVNAIGKLAARLQRDPRPVWRTMLSVYPQDFSDEMVNRTYQKLFK
jgi:hypothetical protein